MQFVMSMSILLCLCVVPRSDLYVLNCDVFYVCYVYPDL